MLTTQIFVRWYINNHNKRQHEKKAPQQKFNRLVRKKRGGHERLPEKEDKENTANILKSTNAYIYNPATAHLLLIFILFVNT